jgi:hypothetical protein
VAAALAVAVRGGGHRRAVGGGGEPDADRRAQPGTSRGSVAAAGRLDRDASAGDLCAVAVGRPAYIAIRRREDISGGTLADEHRADRLEPAGVEQRAGDCVTGAAGGPVTEPERDTDPDRRGIRILRTGPKLSA